MRSVESDASRHHPRPRGLSFTSIRSNAISDGSSNSNSTNALSRKTSHADDSDAADSDSSLGETDQDVWFPNETAGNGDINVDELDQLLNLSDDDTNEHIEALLSQHDNADADNEDDNDEASSQVSQSPTEKSHHSTQGSRAGTGTSRNSWRKSSSPGTGDNFRPKPINASPVGKHKEQAPAGTAAATPPGNPIIQAAGECLSSGSSDNNGEKEKASATEQHVTTTRINNANGTTNNEHSADGPTVGDQPSQRFSFFAPGLDTTIHAPDLASLVGNSESFSTLLDPSNGTWFLDCFRPTDVEMKALSRAFGIHPLTTEDIQTEDAREKYEQFRSYSLVVYHTFENDKDDPHYMETINFYILIFKEGIISFHFEPVSHCRNVRRRMRQLRDYVTFTPDWIAYALIDDITDSYAPEISSVEKEADDVEDAVYLDASEVEMHALLRKLGLARRHTMHLLRMLSGKADVIRGFAKRCTENHSPSSTDMELYLDDIQDHLLTMHQNLSAYEKIFSRTHFNYMGLLQMEFVDSSNRMTEVLGKVTVLGSVLLPMNLVTGLWGMNVQVPGQDVENLHWFFSIMAVILFCVIMLTGGGFLYIRMMNKK